MNKIKVSIIIPVYNAAFHLEQCIRSVVVQTLEEIEIIIVNDGSMDESLKIIRDFEKQDKRIIVIDSVNEGVSAARNKGLATATGEYIGFADADDFAESTMYEVLYRKAKEANADIAICNINVVSKNKDIVARLVLEDETLNIEFNRQKELANLMHFKYDFANWNKVYLSSVIQQHGIEFNEKMKVWEDLLFNLCYFQYAGKMVTTSERLYHYRSHASSVMNSGKHEVVEEYNSLFINFNDYCLQHGFTLSQEAFKKEMGRDFYYAVLPKLEKQIKEKEASGRKRIKLLVSELQKVDKGLFNYSKSELSGVQGLKKQLLKKEKFGFFSFLKFMKP